MSASVPRAPIFQAPMPQPDAGVAPPVPGDDPAAVTEVVIDPDGGVTISAPAVHTPRDAMDPEDFNRNLAATEDMSFVAHDLLEGIEADRLTRREWEDNYAKAIGLLGLKIEDVSTTKAQKRNVSTITHPVLLEAVVKSQGMARGELLPAAGPCKVTLRGDDTGGLDMLAKSLEQDMNAYLTVGAPEYYPDTDRGLFGFFFGGNWFRKVFMHPLRRRPVAESIAVEDMIVSEDAVDLETALRITHRSLLSPTMMRRMQIFGDWLDVTLPPAQAPMDPVTQAKAEETGVRMVGARTQDQPYTVYECTTDLDPADYGLHEPDAPAGLPLPYVVTMEKDSRTVLAMRRGWRQGDPMFARRMRFVHYGMVPAFGFLCLGYAHLLGNHTRALTAAWRLICDAGLFANFPGGVKLKGSRTSTNELAPSPGEWVDIDSNGIDDIRKMMMPMPYKDPSPVYIAFGEQVAQRVERLAGSTNMETGEGRTNIPVGTMMAMVEQSTKLDAVLHKRLHTAHARELQMLKECVAEDPESITKVIPNPSRQWRGKIEFDSIDLVPASDPNVPSQTHRVMLATAMVQMAAANPDIYNKLETHARAWNIIGVNDTSAFLVPQPPPGPPPGDPAASMAASAQNTKAQADMLKAQTGAEDSRRKAATEAIESQAAQHKAQMDIAAKAQEQAGKERLAQIEAQTESIRLQAELARASAQQAQAMSRAHQLGPNTGEGYGEARPQG